MRYKKHPLLLKIIYYDLWYVLEAKRGCSQP